MLQCAHRDLNQRYVTLRFRWTYRQSLTTSVKWPIGTTTAYSLVPLVNAPALPVVRQLHGSRDGWENVVYPYHNLPAISCHIAPPYAIVNGAQKFEEGQVEAIASVYTDQTHRRDIVDRLRLLCEIWGLITGAREDAKKWVESRRKKRRRSKDEEDIKSLSATSSRNSRSKTSSTCGPSRDPSHFEQLCEHQTREMGTPKNESRKRKFFSTSSETILTEKAVVSLGKRQKTMDSDEAIRHWVAKVSSC